MTNRILDSQASGMSQWPSNERSLFQEDGQHPVEFHGYYADSFAHPEAYRRAAEVLFDSVVESPCDRDAIMLPFLFLWRHHVEISLKRLISELNEASGRKAYPPPTHKLSCLWTEVRQALVKIWPKASPEPLMAIGKAIEDLERLDATGEKWRYPTDRKGNSILPTGLRFSLSRFHEVMQGISNLIDGCHSMASEYLSERRRH